MRPASFALAVLLSIGALPMTGSRAAAATLNSQMDALAGGFPGGVAIWVSDPSAAQPLYTRDADRQIITASLYKLAVLLETEHQVDLGRLRYSDTITIDPEDITEDGSFEAPGTELTIDEALEQMITVSDNGTALHLWRSSVPRTSTPTSRRAGSRTSTSRSTRRRTTTRPRAPSARTSRSSPSGSSYRRRRRTG